MKSYDYDTLVALLLDDELTAEQGRQLLEIIERDPEKLRDVCRHLEIWDLYSQSVCPERETGSFTDSWQTRFEATADSDHFVGDLEHRIESDPKPAVAPLGSELELPGDATTRGETIRLFAERAFERFQELERRKREELAYKQYRARRRQLIVGSCSLAFLCLVVVSPLLIRMPPEAPTLPTQVAPAAPPAPPVVASISRSSNARWLGADLPTNPGTELIASRTRLTKGLVELAFEGGAEVILQAPCELELESAGQMFLWGGSVSAKVPLRARGFTVRTRSGTVVDYGTEFGVIARRDGGTETHVYEGKVNLHSGSDPTSSATPTALGRGQAAAVGAAGKITTEQFRPNQIIRMMPEGPEFGIPGERLDLGDIVGGGNGYGTGMIGRGIHPLTGAVVHKNTHRARPGAGNYILVEDLPFVEGVFVPHADGRPTQIDSAGHSYRFPGSSGNWWVEVVNDAEVDRRRGNRMTLENRIYGTPDHPAICLVPNQGITFDLSAIRASLPGTHIVEFSALCGISNNVWTDHKTTDAVFYVFTDGDLAFHQRVTLSQTKSLPVRITLDRGCRRLTLVCTEGSRHEGDWSMFAEPALKLSPDTTESATQDQQESESEVDTPVESAV